MPVLAELVDPEGMVANVVSDVKALEERDADE
jgi:hypothetical protein